MGIFFGIGLMMIFYYGNQESVSFTPNYAMADTLENEIKPWSGDDLLELANVYDQQANELAGEAIRLEQRANVLAQKRNKDPKGFRQNALMTIAGMRWKAARELHELAKMHRVEGQRLKNPQ